MKIIITITLLLCCYPAWPQVAAVFGTGISHPALIRNPQYHNHPATPLLVEDFESLTDYDWPGWGEDNVNGTINPNYTSTVLRGAQSGYFLLADDDQTYITNAIPSSSHLYLSAYIRVLSATGSDKTIFRYTDDSGVCIFKITLNADRELKSVVCQTGGSATPAFPLTIGVTYRIWAEWNRDNGANSYVNIAYSAGQIKPSASDTDRFAEVTSTSTGDNATRLMIGSPNDEVGQVIEYIVDHLIIDDEEIISYP